MATESNTISNLASQYLYNPDTGDVNWAGVGAGLAGLYGLAGGNDVKTAGWSAPPPKLTATRMQVPLDNQYRRPGEAGRRYFSDVVYTPQGDAAALAQAQQQAGEQAALYANQQPQYQPRVNPYAGTFKTPWESQGDIMLQPYEAPAAFTRQGYTAEDIIGAYQSQYGTPEEIAARYPQPVAPTVETPAPAPASVAPESVATTPAPTGIETLVQAPVAPAPAPAPASVAPESAPTQAPITAQTAQLPVIQQAEQLARVGASSVDPSFQPYIDALAQLGETGLLATALREGQYGVELPQDSRTLQQLQAAANSGDRTTANQLFMRALSQVSDPLFDARQTAAVAPLPQLSNQQSSEYDLLLRVAGDMASPNMIDLFQRAKAANVPLTTSDIRNLQAALQSGETRNVATNLLLLHNRLENQVAAAEARNSGSIAPKTMADIRAAQATSADRISVKDARRAALAANQSRSQSTNTPQSNAEAPAETPLTSEMRQYRNVMDNASEFGTLFFDDDIRSGVLTRDQANAIQHMYNPNSGANKYALALQAKRQGDKNVQYQMDLLQEELDRHNARLNGTHPSGGYDVGQQATAERVLAQRRAALERAIADSQRYDTRIADAKAEYDALQARLDGVDWSNTRIGRELGLTAAPQYYRNNDMRNPVDLTPYVAMAEGGQVPEFRGYLESGGFVIPGDVVRHADPTGAGNKEQGLQALSRSLGAQAIRGPGDAMSDSIPATIDGREPAAVANGEAYIPPQQVQRAGGSQRLYDMMDRLRLQRTGSKKQINPDQPGALQRAYQNGGGVKRFGTGGGVTSGTPTTTSATATANKLGTSSMNTLSPYIGEYTTNALGQVAAMAASPYQAYTGPLTAGASDLQQNAFAGIQQLVGTGYTPTKFTSDFQSPAAYQQTQFTNQYTAPTAYNPSTMQSQFNYTAPTGADVTQFTNQFTAPAAYSPTKFTSQDLTQADAARYMNPYLNLSLQPQLQEAQRQADIARLADASRLTKAGAYGGSRQAIMESEGRRNLMDIQGQMIGRGYDTAYQQALAQFNADQGRNFAAQQATEASRQFGAGQSMTAAQLAAQYGLSSQQALEAARQFNAGQALTAAQLQAQFGMEASKANELANQYAYNQKMQQAQLGAQYGLASLQGQSGERQFASQNALQIAQAKAAAAQQAAQNAEASRQFSANFGLKSLADMAALGQQQRAIEAEGIAADKAQFEEERQYAYAQPLYQLGALSGIPIGGTTSTPNTTGLASLQSQISDIGGIYGALSGLFGGSSTGSSATTTPTGTTTTDNWNPDTYTVG